MVTSRPPTRAAVVEWLLPVTARAWFVRNATCRQRESMPALHVLVQVDGTYLEWVFT
jgi:hypothetical protein